MGARRIERLGAVTTKRRAAEVLQRGRAGADAVIIRPDSMLLLDLVLCVQGDCSKRSDTCCLRRLSMQELPLNLIVYASRHENLYARPSCRFFVSFARGPRFTSRFEASCRGIAYM